MEISRYPNQNIISNLQVMHKNINKIKDSISKGDANFIKHCAKENLKDVKTVLDEIYQ